ncbi:MAG: hypothetical protein ABIP94_03815, partial [Planctomycetota bacterium]
TRRAAAALLGLLVACTSASTGDNIGPLQNGPPAIASVRDGLDADADVQESRTTLFANWDPFVDPESLPVSYEWCIGTSPGTGDVQEWTSVGGATHAATSGVTLPAGVTLFVSVRAGDIAGNRSAVSTSNGIVVGVANQPRSSRNRTEPPAVAPGQSLAVKRFGTTWTFDRAVPCGRYVNGDWWVVGPVNIVAIEPRCREDDGRTRHGSMINPDPSTQRQGYDSTMLSDGAPSYEPSANVALGVSAQKPLRLVPGSSLVSSTSHVAATNLPQLETCEVLTCVAEPVPEGAFRPPYCGTDKTSRWVAGKLGLHRLARLEAPEGAPAPNDLLERFERTWLDHVPGWTGRALHPSKNMPDYGRDIADLVGRAALVLQLDFPDEQKRALAIAMVQIGIDLFGIAQSGGSFRADGSSGSGRKFPVLLAAALLQDAQLLACAREAAFAEDAQTFYVAETTPGVYNRGCGGYGAEDVGLPEWGNHHADDPSSDTKSWTGDPFRRCCTANVWHGFVLATRIMGLREDWGHEALFDYVDRYMQVEPNGTWTRSFSPFAERMWDRYRASY